MVVSGTTGQLLRCTKNISTTARYSVFNNKYHYDHKTLVNSNKVLVFPRLTSCYCDCRRFHYTGYSRDTRTTFTKLSPQEVR